MKKISFEEAIKHLNDGKKIYLYNSGIGDYWKINDNVLCKYTSLGKLLRYNDNLYYDVDYRLPEEAKPFEITKTGLYKTSDGRQVYVSDIIKDACYPIIGIIKGCHKENTWKADGKGFYDGESNDNIVAKWDAKEAINYLKVGSYKTRDGRQAFVSYITEKTAYGIIAGNINLSCWKLNGTWNATGNTNNDLIL